MTIRTQAPLCVIVDDHADTREGLAEYLRVNGFAVLEGANASDLAAILEAHTPDAILLDLQLPGVDGWAIAERLRDDPARRGIPLIAVSARVMPAERARALDAGFDSFISKPCDPDQVIDEIRYLLARRGPLG